LPLGGCTNCHLAVMPAALQPCVAFAIWCGTDLQCCQWMPPTPHAGYALQFCHLVLRWAVPFGCYLPFVPCRDVHSDHIFPATCDIPVTTRCYRVALVLHAGRYCATCRVPSARVPLPYSRTFIAGRSAIVATVLNLIAVRNIRWNYTCLLRVTARPSGRTFPGYAPLF
jgi:hypothetical protein